MPVFDWLRTNLHTPLADGSNALSYCHEELMGLDPHCLHLPGWDESYTQSQLDTLLGAYAGMSHGELSDNLVYFLRGIMPACDRAGVNMAIHPDDPPWDMFGLPRIITGADSYARLFAAVPDIHNGITLLHRIAGRRPQERSARTCRLACTAHLFCASAADQVHRRGKRTARLLRKRTPDRRRFVGYVRHCACAVRKRV